MSTTPAGSGPGRSPHEYEVRNLPFDVVFVCTGNRARSPLAALLLGRLTGGAPVRTRSYGTLEVEGLPALPSAVQVAGELGLDLREHRSRTVRGADLSPADLVLGFEPFHLRVAIDEGRADSDRAFLLAELVGLLGRETPAGDPTSRARALVSQAGARRVESAWGSGVSIADPVGKPVDQMRATAMEIDRLVAALAERLFALSDT